MSNFFHTKDKSNEEIQVQDIKSKLYENSNFLNKLDFNVEFLNKYMVKMINKFLQARYAQNIKLCDIYLSTGCKDILIKDILKEKQYCQYKNPKINILDISIIQQNIQSVNYISDIIMEIKVHIEYERHNIFTDTARYIIEEYTQKLWFIFSENGWILEKYYERDFSIYNDDKII